MCIKFDIYQGVSQFIEGRICVCDRPRTGWPAEVVLPTMGANFEVFIRKDVK